MEVLRPLLLRVRDKGVSMFISFYLSKLFRNVPMAWVKEYACIARENYRVCQQPRSDMM